VKSRPADAHEGLLVHLACAAAIAGRALVLVGDFSHGVVKFSPIGPHAREVLETLCPPTSPRHTWHQGEWYGLLVETRYANDLATALRRRDVWVP
jgi:hypothetical protein